MDTTLPEDEIPGGTTVPDKDDELDEGLRAIAELSKSLPPSNSTNEPPVLAHVQPVGNWSSDNWSAIRVAFEGTRRFFDQPSPGDPSKTLAQSLRESVEGIREGNYRQDLRPDIADAIEQSERPAEKSVSDHNVPASSRLLSAADIAAIAAAVASGVTHIFSLKNAVSAALLAAAEYAMLSLIEDAPRAIKFATLVAPVAAFLVIQFEAAIRKLHRDIFPVALAVIFLGYAGFGGYVFLLSPFNGEKTSVPPTPPIVIHDPPTPEQIAKAAEPELKKRDNEIADLKGKLAQQSAPIGFSQQQVDQKIAAATASLNSQLVEVTRQKDAAQQAVQNIPHLGPITTLRMIDNFGEPDRNGNIAANMEWAIVITQSNHATRLREIFTMVLAKALKKATFLPAPDQSNLDTPRLPDAEKRPGGFTLHGDNLLNAHVREAFGPCVNIHTTNTDLPDLASWYKLPSQQTFVWVEVGDAGEVWRNYAQCKD